VRILYDASSLFNLASGEMLDLVHRNSVALIGPQVYDECTSIREKIDTLIDLNRIELIDDSSMPIDLFFKYLEKFELGNGETECICFAIMDSQIDRISCDDRKARQAISAEIGRHRLTGTLGQLAIAASQDIIKADEALKAYRRMIAAGGFLPSISPAKFDELVNEQLFST